MLLQEFSSPRSQLASWGQTRIEVCGKITTAVHAMLESESLRWTQRLIAKRPASGRIIRPSLRIIGFGVQPFPVAGLGLVRNFGFPSVARFHSPENPVRKVFQLLRHGWQRIGERFNFVEFYI